MEPIKVTWPGSDDLVTIHRSPAATYAERDDIAEFLSSRYPHHFPMQPDPERPGERMSVNQRLSWMALLADLGNAGGGVVLVARHTAGSNRVIAVAIAGRNGHAGEAEMVIQSEGGYESERLAPLMLATLRQQCMSAGLMLGRAITVRKWVPA